MAEVTLSSKGQIVLPKELREALGLAEGDRVRLTLEDDHLAVRAVRVRGAGDWRKWRGCLGGTNALQEHEAEHADEVSRERLP